MQAPAGRSQPDGHDQTSPVQKPSPVTQRSTRNESAHPRGGRSHSTPLQGFHREQPVQTDLAATESNARHRAWPHGGKILELRARAQMGPDKREKTGQTA